MACGISTIRRTVTSTALVLLVLMHLSLVWEQSSAAPAKKSDILAGTEFLSVFINGAMASRPYRKRPSLRRPAPTPIADSATAESRQDEASIFRISRAPSGRTVIAQPQEPDDAHLYNEKKIYPVSRKSLGSRQSLIPLVDSNSAKKENPTTQETPSNKTNHRMVNQRVIGVSVTSTVEATPYKVRVEHHDVDRTPPMSRGILVPVISMSTSKSMSTSTMISTTTAAPTTHFTPQPAQLVTEEVTNIVSESNRSEFSVEEGAPNTSWRERATATPRSTAFSQRHREDSPVDSAASSSNSEPVEQSYELPEQNNEPREMHQEPPEVVEGIAYRGRKAGRHYDESISYADKNAFSDPSKVYHQNLPPNARVKPRIYQEPAKIYGKPEKVYGEPAKVYSEPAKIYGEPAKVYGEPAKVYGEPAKIYGEPEKVYSEPAKVYSVPAKVYSEPSRVYDSNGRPVQQQQEPEEQNYEVDEAVHVGSNGNAHGPQETPRPESQDNRKVSYVEEGRNYRKYRVEERTPDGFIVGEYGVVSHDDGSLRGVRYTADGTINPKLIYDALMKFLAL